MAGNPPPLRRFIYSSKLSTMGTTKLGLLDSTSFGFFECSLLPRLHPFSSVSADDDDDFTIADAYGNEDDDDFTVADAYDNEDDEDFIGTDSYSIEEDDDFTISDAYAVAGNFSLLRRFIYSSKLSALGTTRLWSLDSTGSGSFDCALPPRLHPFSSALAEFFCINFFWIHN